MKTPCAQPTPGTGFSSAARFTWPGVAETHLVRWLRHSIMNSRNFSLALLALTLAGCVTPTVLNDASKWTIELASSEPSPSGPCRIYDDLHRLMLDGTLASGKMDGTWTSTGSDGTRLATWSYRQGVRHGPVKMWYGPLAYPGAGGHTKLEGTFVDGSCDGAVARFYPSGTRQCVRVYEHGVLRSSQSWSQSGSEVSPSAAMREAEFEQKQDMAYLSTLEDMVTRSLAQARREVRK